MYFSAIQQCPNCDGAIPRERFVMLDWPDWPWIITMLWCEHCEIGIECLWRRPEGDAGEPVMRTKVAYRRERNPVDYGKFLQRLESSSTDREVLRHVIREFKEMVA